ncbi:MAG: hypothetical protein SXQ77_09130, partial [Halobacteria archaeon]|nr:hypothetical protein [Halobacteria archaeon]
DLVLGWEPRGDWKEKTGRVKDICDDLDLVHVVDLMRDEPVSSHPVAYVRLHGLNEDPYDYDYDYHIDVGDYVLKLQAYRSGVNAFVRWETDEDEGERGGIAEGDKFVFDIEEYVVTGGKGETEEIPRDAFESLSDELDAIREEAIEDELTEEEARSFEADKHVILRAKEILEDRGAPEIGEYGTYEFEKNGRVIELGVEPRAGVAEILVRMDNSEGYSPRYELDQNRLTLPPSPTWSVVTEIDIPEDVADDLLDDLISLQEELNERSEVYEEAVKQARDELDL